MPKKLYNCFHCQKLFERWPSQICNPKKCFCSRNCKGIWQKEGLKRENNPNYKHPYRILVHGRYKELCECGGLKDYRAKQCKECMDSNANPHLKYKPFPKQKKVATSLLVELINQANSFLDAEKKSEKILGIKLSRSEITRRTKKLGLCVDHFVYCSHRPPPIDKVLTKNSQFSGTTAKKTALREGLLQYICYCCNNTGEWLGKPITLEIHHKNGDSKDHRVKNICLLCPNCHAQTDTHRGGNMRKEEICQTVVKEDSHDMVHI